MNEKTPGRTVLLSDQSAVRALHLDGVRLTYAVDGAMGLLPQAYGHGENGPGATPAAILEQLAATRTLVDPGEEIFPGIRAMVTPGHTPGHTAYIITSGTRTRLIAVGDAFHIPGQVTHPEWLSWPGRVLQLPGPRTVLAPGPWKSYVPPDPSSRRPARLWLRLPLSLPVREW
jgi:glyoxylase-like metal-dependent hydrolase (beta-lactamase superfamily II)